MNKTTSTFKVLGLDLSAKTLGISIISSNSSPKNPLFSLEHLNLTQCDSIKQKTDALSECFQRLFSENYLKALYNNIPLNTFQAYL